MIYIYLDESGDLGWKFDAPYRCGGSSRFLTISALLVPDEKKHLPKRIIQKLYKKFKWNSSEEKKWADMKHHERIEFSNKAHSICSQHTDIKYFSITVKKERVKEHIRMDPNKLYNYMIKLLLVEEMATYPNITFVPDPRSIKVESGNSLHDYLQTDLWFEQNSGTVLNTDPQDSSKNRNLQFIDMLCGAIQNHFEDSKSEYWHIVNGYINYKCLYFRE